MITISVYRLCYCAFFVGHFEPKLIKKSIEKVSNYAQGVKLLRRWIGTGKCLEMEIRNSHGMTASFAGAGIRRNFVWPVSQNQCPFFGLFFDCSLSFNCNRIKV